MKSAFRALALLTLLLAAVPAFAGTLYIPVASSQVVDDRNLQTQLFVSNPTDETLEFTTFFIASGSNGTLGDRNLLTPQQVAPGRTMFVQNAAPSGETGMLEVNSDAGLVFSAKLLQFDQSGELSGARLPLVGSQNLLAAGDVAQLLALERTQGGRTLSNVGVINLSQEASTCTAEVFTSAGTQVGGTAILPMSALGHVQFDEALALIGLQAANTIRVEISCDREFYAYATILARDPEETLFVQPSNRGDSALLAPGLLPPFVEFNRAGVFHNATQQNPYQLFQVPVEAGVAYDRIEIDFDFFLGGFNTDLFHTVFSLRSGGLFCELTIRGDNRRSFWDTPDQSVRATGPWRPGNTYHVHVTYDISEDLALLEISQNGQVLQVMEARANRPVLGAIDGSLRIDFSQQKVFDNAFFPLWGSRFSNLEITVFEQL